MLCTMAARRRLPVPLHGLVSALALRTPSELRFTRAQCSLGKCYDSELGARKDAGKGVEWFRLYQCE